MSAPCSSACSPAFEVDAGCISCAGHPEDVLDTAISAATDMLFEMTGRRFPGSCQMTVRPCATGCRCRGGCRGGCSTPSQVLLGAQPVTGIEEVKVDGVALAASLYRIDEYRYLVRLPDADGTRPGWPTSNDLSLADTEEGTWSVTFNYGVVFPPLMVMAAKELACELAKACCSDDTCTLPPRMVSMSRQGLDQTFANLSDFLDDGKIGLRLCDLAVKTYNPQNLRRRGRWASPDVRPAARRVGT